MSYTYLIGWSDKKMYYYGVRYAKDCDPSDLMTSYFTSSIYVKKYIKKFGLPDIIQIRKTFSDQNVARLWEHKVLRRLDAKRKKYFLNKTDNISFPHLCGMDSPHYGKRYTRSNATKKKLSELAKMRIGDKNPFYNRKHSDKTKLKISKTKKSADKILCGACNNSFDIGNYRKWHGENCGKYKSSGTEKMVKINNRIFESLSSAAKHFKVCNATITYRIKSENFDYSIIGGI